MINKIKLLEIHRDTLRRMATYASIGVAALLIAAKLIAYMKTDSVAMLTSLFDSVFDLMGSLITAYAVARALHPPDREHRFGHGKAEPLAALAQSIFIIGSSLFLFYEAGSRFYTPHEIANESVGYVTMALAIVLIMSLVLFQKYVVSRTGSSAIGADRLHYVGDLAVNFAVVAAFFLHRLTGLSWFDPVFAIIIALALLFSAVHILKQSMFSLMDEELPQPRRDKIREIVLGQDGVYGLHDMRTRTDGERIFIELHVEMDGNKTLCEAHDLTEKINKVILAEIPNADIIVHQDPVGVEEFRLDEHIESQT